MNPNQSDIISALNLFAKSSGTPPPPVTLPALNFSVPTDLPQKYQEFLQHAAQNPDIINYYNQILDYTKGDLTLAQQQLEQDYQTGVRQTTDTLGNSLKQLGLTFTGESNNLLDSLNKRGIALTQDASGKLTYGGGGESQTELGQLNQSQQLRQEAEQRSAQQNIENAGLKLNSGLTSAGQQARNQALSINQQKTSDIYQRASVPWQNYLNSQQISAANAQNNQFNSIAGGGTKTKSQIAADFTAGGGKGDVPVGYEGYGSASA